MIIDTHSHLFTEEFDDDLPEVMSRAREAGVGRIYMPNIDASTVEALLRVCRAYEGYCFPMLGLHPTSVNAGYQAELDALKPMLDEPSHPFVAIGEVGLGEHEVYLAPGRKYPRGRTGGRRRPEDELWL